eukprot:m.264170 g.264170  ORF g.264170 m.264170 type:complete len:61 (+) comp11053_c2_seq16:574-756(+)
MPCSKGFLLRSLAPSQLKAEPQAATRRAQRTVPTIDLRIARRRSIIAFHPWPGQLEAIDD